MPVSLSFESPCLGAGRWLSVWSAWRPSTRAWVHIPSTYRKLAVVACICNPVLGRQRQTGVPGTSDPPSSQNSKPEFHLETLSQKIKLKVKSNEGQQPRPSTSTGTCFHTAHSCACGASLSLSKEFLSRLLLCSRIEPTFPRERYIHEAYKQPCLCTVQA